MEYTNKKRCYIVGAGEFCETKLPENDDFIIAADGGYTALVARGITPDLVIGDFDSLGYIPNHPNIIRCSVEKDDTDMMLDVKQGLKLGYKEFVINGSLGGRLDQTLANIHILAYIAEHDAYGLLINRDIFITVIKDSEIKLNKDISIGKTLSIFCHSDIAEGVSLTGLKYPLSNATIKNTYPIGVSNEIVAKEVIISVTKGSLIIFGG